MAVVFNDNKSRCELYNLESEMLKDKEGSKLRRINSVMYQDDFSILDNLLLGTQRNEFFTQSNNTFNNTGNSLKYRKKTETSFLMKS